jgi:gliding motility-associated-like protein
MPIAAFTVPDSLSCTGRMTLLPVNQSQNANLFTWNWGDGTQNSTTAYVPFAHTYTNVGQYVLSLVASDRTCADTATRIIVVANKPLANFVASETETCDTAIIRLQNITSNANSFNWSVNNGLYTSTEISPIFSLPPSSAPYTIQLIVANSAGCKDTVVKANYIRAIPLPPADFYINPAPVITVPNYSFSYTNLTPNSPLYQYSWSLGDNTYANTRDVLNHLYPDTGSYAVQLVVIDTSTNCLDTVVKIVRIVGQPGYLYVPNAFYPNSIDVQFRSFKPLGKGLAEYELQIFDNWGKLLFQTNRLDAAGSPVEGWDGTYKGMPMAQDAYAWRIRAKFRNGRYWEGMLYNQQQYGSPGHTFGTVTLFR